MREVETMPRQTRKKVTQAGEETGHSRPMPQPPAITSSLIPDHILSFLNAFPTTGDVVEWVNGFREALRQILGDVDKVVVTINIHCDLLNPEQYSPVVFIHQHSSANQTVVESETDETGRTKELLDQFQQLGYDLEQYHPPHSFNYYYGSNAFLGTILLLRDRTKMPISARTLETMTAMEPFIIFLLSDLVTRHYYAKPVDRIFPNVLTNLRIEAGLSGQDIRILSLMLLGYSYKQVADRMELSLDTIRKHTKRIYRKTRTGSLPELFAKYFTPRIGIEGLGEEDSY